MKGIATMFAVLIVMIAIGITVTGLLTNTFFQTNMNYVEVLKERLLISALNQLSLAKISVTHALRYALFQACYEKAKNGFCDGLCYENGLKYWRNYSSTKMPTLNNIIHLIGNRSTEIFNEYANELSARFSSIDGRKMIIPTLNKFSNELKIDKDDKFIQLNVSTSKKIRKYVGLVADSKESYIEQNFNFSIKDFIPIIKMFSFGRKIAENDFVGESVVQAIRELPSDCKTQEKKFCEDEDNPCPNCKFLDIDIEKCKEDFEEKFLENMDNRLKSIREDAKSYDIKINYKVNNFYFLINGNCRNLGCEEDESCGCKREECSCTCLQYNEVDGDCECLKWNLEDCTCLEYNIEGCECFSSEKICECEEYYESNTMSCRYNWKVAADILINISTDYVKYPVYDSNEKTTKFRNLMLLFNVKSGYYDAEKNYLEGREELRKNVICEVERSEEVEGLGTSIHQLR